MLLKVLLVAEASDFAKRVGGLEVPAEPQDIALRQDSLGVDSVESLAVGAVDVDQEETREAAEMGLVNGFAREAAPRKHDHWQHKLARLVLDIVDRLKVQLHTFAEAIKVLSDIHQ